MRNGIEGRKMEARAWSAGWIRYIDGESLCGKREHVDPERYLDIFDKRKKDGLSSVR